MNLNATKALVEQLPLAYQLAENIQNKQGVKIYNGFSLIFEICYTFCIGQAQLTANDSTDEVFGDIAAAGATAAWKIAIYFIGFCELTNAKAYLQKFGNLGDEAGPLYASFTSPVSSKRPANAGGATTQSRCLLNEDVDKINKDSRQTDLWTNKRAKVAK